MKKIAFLTTSKGRLHHIRKTLPLMVAQAAAEVVVVDYGCPDHTGDWVEANFPTVKVVRVTDDEGFCLARARNLCARHSQSDWLVFIDGDVESAAGWVDWMQQHVAPGHFYRAAPIGGERDPDTYGTLICARTDFEAIGGFDEAFRGWGGEDDDFYGRLRQHGVVEADYPAEFVNPIRHGDEERAGLSGVRDRRQQIVVNQCYRAAKAQFARLSGKGATLSLETRVKLLNVTQQALSKWFDEGAAKPFDIRYVLYRGQADWLPAPFAMATELVFVVRVGRRARS